MARRPVYLADERLDDLARMCLSLVGEVWTLRDRVTVLEHALEQRGGLSRAELDELVPSGALAAELARERAALIQRVVGSVVPAARESTVDGAEAATG